VFLLGWGGAGTSLAQDVLAPAMPDVELPRVAERGDLVMSLQSLRIKVKERGHVPVIVGLRMKTAPEAKLAQQQQASQRQRIASMQAAVLAELMQGRMAQVKRFRYSPFLALAATPADLERLIASDRVQFIAEDEAFPPLLAQSVPLVGSSSSGVAGYTGTGWSVAVLDDGVQRDHPFLAGKVVQEACFSTSNTSYSSETLCPNGAESEIGAGAASACAECDHGTHVAGIVSGSNATSSGVASGSALIAVQVFSRFFGEEQCGPAVPACIKAWTSDLLQGLEYVFSLREQRNIAAVNMSLGGGQYQSYCDSSPLKPAIDNLRAAGIATVVASGNEGLVDALSNPACVSSAVSVGATYDAAGYANRSYGWDGGISSVDAVASFSNTANMLDLYAPGAMITASAPWDLYVSYAGTSMAAPHVAGCWAVLRQVRPDAGVDEIEQAIKSTGAPVADWRNGVAKPRLDCRAAVNALNSIVSTARAPDLYPSTFSLDQTSVAAGSSVNVYASVKNGGESASPSTNLRFLRSIDSVITPADDAVCTIALPPLAGGTSSSGQPCVALVPATQGTYHFGVCVDPVAGERQTGNNCSEPHAVSVVATSLADLVVTQVSADASVRLGDSLYVAATLTNASRATAESSLLDIFLVEAGTSKEVPLAYCDVPLLFAGQAFSCAGPIPLPMDLQAGSFRVAARADTEGAVTEVNEANNVRYSDNLTSVLEPPPALSLGEAVDSGLPWISGGNSKWFREAVSGGTDGDAARSGAISHGEYSYVQTTVMGPATFSFRWRVSSEGNYDFLALMLDDVLVDYISGEVDWTSRSVTIPVGSHRLTWAYIKDESISLGQDAAWLDQVVLFTDNIELRTKIEQWRNARQRFLPVH